MNPVLKENLPYTTPECATRWAADCRSASEKYTAEFHRETQKKYEYITEKFAAESSSAVFLHFESEKGESEICVRQKVILLKNGILIFTHLL